MQTRQRNRQSLLISTFTECIIYLTNKAGGAREMNREQKIEYIKKWLEGASDKALDFICIFIEKFKD